VDFRPPRPRGHPPESRRSAPWRREAIQLALAENVPLILIAGRGGARLAGQHGLNAVGALAILVAAANAGLLNIDAALARLQNTSFRCRPTLLERARQMVRRSQT